ncbi:MAG: hypothetical protein KGO80_09605, partial [Bacteroidetes bacterium]|nr:hypothetical protein [Bacteroidota bacterium]
VSYPEKYFYSGAILAGAAAIAAGAALSFKNKGTTQIAISGFGESATDEGIFWETIGYAALAKLPVVFICENNKYSVFSPQLKRQVRDNLSEKVAAFGVKAIPLFGNDVLAVYRALKEGMEHARSGGGPVFIEAYTYRWSGHYGPASDDLVGYRPNEEIKFWKDNCPIKLLKNTLLRQKIWGGTFEESCSSSIRVEIEDAFAFAKESKFPTKTDWQLQNLNPKTPMADKLLKEIDIKNFDANQIAKQVKGY